MCTNSSKFLVILNLSVYKIECMCVPQSRDVINIFKLFTCSFYAALHRVVHEYLQFVLAPVLPVYTRGVHVVSALNMYM